MNEISLKGRGHGGTAGLSNPARLLGLQKCAGSRGLAGEQMGVVCTCSRSCRRRWWCPGD